MTETIPMSSGMSIGAAVWPQFMRLASQPTNEPGSHARSLAVRALCTLECGVRTRKKPVLTNSSFCTAIERRSVRTVFQCVEVGSSVLLDACNSGHRDISPRTFPSHIPVATNT